MSDLIQFRIISGNAKEVEKKVSNFFSSFRKDQIKVLSVNTSSCFNANGLVQKVEITVTICFIDLRN